MIFNYDLNTSDNLDSGNFKLLTCGSAGKNKKLDVDTYTNPTNSQMFVIKLE